MIPISDMPGRRHRFPLINVLLIAANILVFFVFQVGQPSERALEQFIRAAGVIPTELVGGVDRPPLAPLPTVYSTLLTSMFLHGGLMHLGSNMLYLWVFGDNVEDALGAVPYVIFYTLCGLLAGLAHVAMNLDSNIPSIGASGAIAGVLGGYLVLYPNADIRTLVFLGPFITMTRVKALLLIGFWFVLQLFSGLVGSFSVESAQTGGVAFWAHIGGFVAGFILIRFFRVGSATYAARR
jgi:membrane associated rhomboid family serine protease